uniref:Uncharacterized protein n=1 Tax=Rhabditophanes sp. KR3021 TaxID=114890 RepID=A0AC35THE8_9BILA
MKYDAADGYKKTNKISEASTNPAVSPSPNTPNGKLRDDKGINKPGKMIASLFVPFCHFKKLSSNDPAKLSPNAPPAHLAASSDPEQMPTTPAPETIPAREHTKTPRTKTKVTPAD